MAPTRVVVREPAPRSLASQAPRRPFVVDASVGAAWVLPDEAAAYTNAALQATAVTHVWVPTLWLVEMANLLQSAQRRRRISAAKRVELASGVDALRLQVCREPVALAALDALAAEHGLSAFDACYLELALRRKLSLATVDAQLMTAMRRCSVPPASLETG